MQICSHWRCCSRGHFVPDCAGQHILANFTEQDLKMSLESWVSRGCSGEDGAVVGAEDLNKQAHHR